MPAAAGENMNDFGTGGSDGWMLSRLRGEWSWVGSTEESARGVALRSIVGVHPACSTLPAMRRFANEVRDHPGSDGARPGA